MEGRGKARKIQKFKMPKIVRGTNENISSFFLLIFDRKWATWLENWLKLASFQYFLCGKILTVGNILVKL